MTATVEIPARRAVRHRRQRVDAAVLIPAHNEARTITQCILAVQRQTVDVADVVVVADACTDATADLARELGVRVLEVDVEDKAAAQNAALPSITAELIVGFDADTFPQPDCVERMVALLDSGYDAVCASILPVQPRGFTIRARRYGYALGRMWWRPAQAAVGRLQVLTGAAYTFRTAAVRAVGGFPTVGISADMDLTWTFHAAGLRCGFAADAAALTVDPDTFAAYRAQMRRWAAGYFQTMAKHRRQMTSWRSALVVGTALFDLVTLPASYAFIVYAITHDLPAARWYPVWFLGHQLLSTALVARVVGWREALAGVVPYNVLNLYAKGLYLTTMAREWLWGRRYSAWTGRAGRKTVITPMTGTRRLVLANMAAAVWVASMLVNP